MFRQVTRGEGDNHTNRVQYNDSGDSIASVVLPRRALRLTRSLHPPVVLDGSSHRSISACNFFLCLCSVMLLVSGISLVGTSFWALLGRIPYLYMSDHTSYLGITSFTISAGMLCFPCSWLAWAAHSRRSGTFIPLLSLFLCVSVVMLGTGTGLGITYRTTVSFDWNTQNMSVYDKHYGMEMRPKLQPGPYRAALNGSMTASQHMYDVKSMYRIAWDSTQSRLRCCGVNTAADWLKVRAHVPSTCCEMLTCTNDTIYPQGCLDAIAFDLAWQTSLLTGIGFMVVFMELTTLMLSSYLYMKMRIRYRGMHARLASTNHNLGPPASAPPPSYCPTQPPSVLEANRAASANYQMHMS